MCEYWLGERLHVIRNHVVPAIGGREGLRCADERECGANARPEAHLSSVARCVDQPGHIIIDGRVHEHCARQCGELDDGIGREHRRNDDFVRATMRSLKNADRGSVIRVADRCFHDETIELRLRQPVGAGLLDRILCSDHHERHGDRVSHAIRGDLPFFHHLEERSLGLRARPVNFVSEHDIGEDRPFVKLERTASLVVDTYAGDVAREQVRRELHTVAGAAHALRDGAGERGLAGARHVFEQQVPLTEQRRERKPDDVLLAEQHLLYSAHQPLEGIGELGGLLRSHRH